MASQAEMIQAMAAEQVSNSILKSALAEEKKLDEQIKKMGEMDEDDFEIIRQRRRLEMQKKMRQEADWRLLGHGSYSEVTDTKEFFTWAKKSERVIAHFYRGVTPRCEIVDAHFSRLCATHPETRFIKVNVEKNPFLVEKLRVIMIPTIVLIKNGKTEHSIIGFDEFGGSDDFSTEDVAYVLSQHGLINYEADRSEELAQKQSKKGVNSVRLNHFKSSAYDDDDDMDD